MKRLWFFGRLLLHPNTGLYLWAGAFSHWGGSHVRRNGMSRGVSATNDSSALFERLSMKTPTSNCPCNAYQRCQFQLERKDRAIFPLQREQKMEERRGSAVSPESSADGFISKFKNTDRRDGSKSCGARTLTGTCYVRVHRYTVSRAQAETRFMHSDNMQSISF